MTKRNVKKVQNQKWFTQGDAHGAASKFGQLIGEAFQAQVYSLIEQYLNIRYPDYILLEPAQGKTLVKLEMFGGTSRQMDNVIIHLNSDDPVALFESKWLKDGRHHNDKGAWILQLREIRKRYPTVRGAVANLAGYWTEGVTVMFESEGGIKTVLVATDEEVYNTLQPFVAAFCTRHHLPPLLLDKTIIRNSLPRSWDMANCLVELEKAGELNEIAKTWLSFTRQHTDEGTSLGGADLVKMAIDDLLEPLPENPKVATFEIALQIDTGNTIYKEFSDGEEALQFIQTYFRNPKAILDKISPKKK